MVACKGEWWVVAGEDEDAMGVVAQDFPLPRDTGVGAFTFGEVEEVVHSAANPPWRPSSVRNNSLLGHLM